MKTFGEVKVGQVIYRMMSTTFRKYKVTDIDILPFDNSFVIYAEDCDTPNMNYFFEAVQFIVDDPNVSNINNTYFTTFNEALRYLGGN